MGDEKKKPTYISYYIDRDNRAHIACDLCAFPKSLITGEWRHKGVSTAGPCSVCGVTRAEVDLNRAEEAAQLVERDQARKRALEERKAGLRAKRMLTERHISSVERYARSERGTSLYESPSLGTGKSWTLRGAEHWVERHGGRSVPRSETHMIFSVAIPTSALNEWYNPDPDHADYVAARARFEVMSEQAMAVYNAIRRKGVA